VSKRTTARHYLASVSYLAPAYAVFVILINLAVYLAADPRVLANIEPLRNRLLPSAIAVNLSTAALILLFSHFYGWRRHLRLATGLDLLTATGAFALLWCLSFTDMAVSLRWFGCIYTAFLYTKAALLVWYALVNAPEKGPAAFRIWVFAVTLLIYCAITPWVALNAWPDGDEPHYLMLTHSLVVDWDYDLANNYRLGQYKSYYPANLGDHHTVLNLYKEELPIHDIGLSVALVPGYTLGGRIGAMIETNLIGAIAILGLFTLALQIGASLRAAIAVWGLFAFTYPLVVFSSQLYPEISGAALTVWSVIAFARFQRTKRWPLLIAVGTFLSLLPWLSIRFWEVSVPVFTIVALYIMAQWRSEGWTVVLRNMLVLVLPLLLSFIGFALFDRRYFGILLPNAGALVFGRMPGSQSSFVLNGNGFFGLLFDRSFGLIPLAPVYIIGLGGVWVLLKKKLGPQPWVSLTILVLSAICILLPGFNKFWYGAWSPPARYLVISIVLWAPLAGLALSNKKARPIVVILTMWSVFIGFVYTTFPLTRYTIWNSGKTGALSQFISSFTGLDYGLAFPSFSRPTTLDYLMVALWIVVTLVCAGILIRTPKRPAA